MKNIFQSRKFQLSTPLLGPEGVHLWELPLALPLLSNQVTNDINIITSLQCTSFYLCIIYNFNDLIHWKDKPLKRWQLLWFTVVTVCCMATFSHNDCGINLSTCTWTFLGYIRSIYHSENLWYWWFAQYKLNKLYCVIILLNAYKSQQPNYILWKQQHWTTAPTSNILWQMFLWVRKSKVLSIEFLCFQN